MKMNIPDSWVSSETDSLINNESSKLRHTKELVSEEFGLNNHEIVRKDLTYVAIPEILSAQYCVLSDNNSLLTISPPLQAFLAYAISIYDTVSDNHLYKNGKPTFLKTYGMDSVLFAERIYKRIIRKLSKELEREIPRATEIVEEMYYGTIEWDKVRNSRIVSSDEAVLLQDKLAGEHAYNIAVLSNAEELGPFSSHLANAITTLEDLIDLFHGEDFTGKKTTIPIAFLFDEFGHSVEDYKIIKKSLAVKRTKSYISEQIGHAREILFKHKSKEKFLLSKIICDVYDFNIRFPEEYL